MTRILISCFILTYLSLANAQQTDAKFISDKYIEVSNEDAKKIEALSPQILSKKYPGCEKVSLALDCLKIVVGKLTTRSPQELVAITKLSKEALENDIHTKKILKLNGLVTVSDVSILSLERFDLTKSWLNSYKVKYPEDVQFFEQFKEKVIQSTRLIRREVIEVVVSNSTEIFKNRKRGDKLHAEALEQLKKLKPLRDQFLHF